jgi:hypothetical protein
MNRAAIEKIIVDELARIALEGIDGKRKVARWKIREIRGMASQIAVKAELSGRDGTMPVDAAVVVKGVQEMLRLVGSEQSIGYKLRAKRMFERLRDSAHRDCCSLYYISIWPFCDAGC